ncbi:MAG TPA: hypothetical protein VF516_28715 [Kofleriaceae bacterium]
MLGLGIWMSIAAASSLPAAAWLLRRVSVIVGYSPRDDTTAAATSGATYARSEKWLS